MEEVNHENRVDFYVYILSLPESLASARTVEQRTECAIFLQSFATQMLTTCEKWTRGHIWHKDPFDLYVCLPPVAGGPRPPCLAGHARFGDNIDDEWFIVYLLREITKQFPVAVSVSDNDGEFLLIEAALTLPSWLDPDTSDNRIFLYKSELHIIPMPRSPAEFAIFPSDSLSISTALTLLQRHTDLTRASREVQAPISLRLGEFPGRVKQLRHRARCHVPIGVAHVLSQCPQLVAAAVEAFYTRDLAGMKASSSMKRFPPSKSVTTTVTFTRYLYAQLVSQRFFAPKPFRLPAPSSPEFNSHELGMKLACGFEILCSEDYYGIHGSSRNSTEASAVPIDWERFVDSLTSLGYFRGELPGSILYRELLSAARQHFENELLIRQNDKDPNSTDQSNRLEFENPGAKVIEILKMPIANESDVICDDPADGIEWMTVSEADVDREMRERSATKPSVNEATQKAASDMESVVEGLTSFMNRYSGIDGVELPDDLLDDNDDDDDDDDDMDKDEDADDEAISFNVDQFADAIESVLGSLKNSTSSAPKSQEQQEVDDKPLEEYMQAMDEELAQTEALSGFERSKETTSQEQNQEPSHQPVNINLNLVKNILESFNAQQGLAGPVSNILGSLGLHLPDVSQESDDE